MHSSPPRISVVIPTHERRDSVERALRSLLDQTLPAAEYEVVVSIDGSNDGTQEMVANFGAPFPVRALLRPRSGRAAACNAGIRAARGALIVLLDDDMEPTRGFLAAHADAHRDGSRRAVLGAVPVVRERSSPVVDYIASSFDRHLEKLSRPDHEIVVRDVYTGNFSIPRATMQDVGLFDEGFTMYGNEDGELAIRLREAGVPIVYCANALAFQHYEKDFPALAQDKIAQGRTSVVCALRHPETIPSLRIGTYRQASRRWILLRRALLAASRLLHSLPRWIIRYIQWSERRRVPNLKSQYHLALDYFYWLGVFAALHDDPAAAGRLIP